ncbi:MAG: glycoside hydrolase family 3 N-terminal domain-containing protein [Elusimicrobia bacterium]|nr:glycoside hydrolase family 3 N-terminal domain-containing protein [Elusimicrobiota bacterium]
MNVNRLIYPGFWFGNTNKQVVLEMARRGAGGFCIYGGTREAVKELIRELRANSPLAHLFICADYEDGLGRWIGGEPWVLSNLAVGASASEKIAYQKGLTLAREARALGVDWVFAPVLDLCDEPQNPIVNTRSFGANPHLVARLGAALCKGLSDGGVLNSIKHFPGHGRTAQDSHLGLPVLHRTLKELQENELVPFAHALPAADSVMIGHLLIPSLDEQNPASLSHKIITEILKEKMNFGGLVFTDALCMKAIGDEKQASLKALQAGAHILLAAEDSVALSDFLEKNLPSDEIIAESEKLQNALVQKLTSAPKEGLSPQAFNARYAPDCAVWTGENVRLERGWTAAYLELGNNESFAAQDFLDALQTAGVRVVKAGEAADALLAVSFSNYKAFKGRINLSSEEQRALENAAAQYKKSVFISFGSPFGAEKISALTARLFLFSPAREAQTCAAQILLGRQTAHGKIPVQL